MSTQHLVNTSEEHCLHCSKRQPGWFCNFAPKRSSKYDGIVASLTLPPGAVLFSEGQRARSVVTLCSGRIKLTRSSVDGRTLLLRIAKPGDVLGLNAALHDLPYEVTAQTIEPCHIKAFPRKEFIQFIERNPEGSLHAAETLGKEYIMALNGITRLALSSTIAGRIANLLLELAQEEEDETIDQPEIHLPLKHEDLASMLGSSRESITRTLNDLKREGLIDIRGTRITLLQKNRLKHLR